MRRIENVEEPLGEGSVGFGALSVVEIDDAKGGEQDSGGGAKGLDDSYGRGGGFHVFYQVQKPKE